MYLRVTRLTQRDQITPIVCATFTQWLLMMDLFSLHDYPSFKTQLTEGMLCSILVTDPLPSSAVPFLCKFVTLVLFIVTVDLLLMLRTVAPIRQIRTAGITARSFRFTWHMITPLSGQKKSPTGSLPQGSAYSCPLFYDISITRIPYNIVSEIGQCIRVQIENLNSTIFIRCRIKSYICSI